MFKKVEKSLPGSRRKTWRTVMVCDRCGRIINWCKPHRYGQFCEDCLKELEKSKKTKGGECQKQEGQKITYRAAPLLKR